MIGAWHRQLVRGSGFGWWWAALVADGARDGAVARGLIFDSKTHHLLVTKLRSDHPHRHQMPNQTVCRTKIPHVRSDLTVEHFVYKMSTPR